jgi:predicted RNase H-like HicB family nuclease
MKTKADLKNEVKLTPVFTKDRKADYCKAHYKGFPKAFAQGKTEQEAELNLLQIFIVLLKERREQIREQSLNSYYSE